MGENQDALLKKEMLYMAYACKTAVYTVTEH